MSTSSSSSLEYSSSSSSSSLNSSSSSSKSSESWNNISSSSSSSSSSFLDYNSKKTLPFVFSVNTNEMFSSIITNNREIYVGTTPYGVVLKSSDGNLWQELYSTNDVRVNGLYFESSINTLYIGTGPKGYIYAYNIVYDTIKKYRIGNPVKGFAKINNKLYAIQEIPPVIMLLDMINDKWDVVYELKFGILEDIKVYNNKIYMAIDKGYTGNSIITYDGQNALLIGGVRGCND